MRINFFNLFLIISLILLIGCSQDDSHSQHDSHGQHQEHDSDLGPNGGKLFAKDDFELELKIYEAGVPPQFRVYGYVDEQPIAPQDMKVVVTTKRLGADSEKFQFTPQDHYLVSGQEVKEPHSFDLEISAEYQNNKYKWTTESYEGRTTLSDSIAARSGVITAKAEKYSIHEILKAKGKIVPSEHKIAHIIARFSGIVKEGRKHIGDAVSKGEVLATIESNESLEPFEVKSQIAGTVINGHLIVGEYVPENQWVYIVADLSDVWVDFYVPISDRNSIAIGQSVKIQSLDLKTESIGKVSYVAPYADERAQAQLVRVILPNKTMSFLPGMFVTGEILIKATEVDLAVKNSALQSFRDWKVVFIKVGEQYEARPLTLGITDGEYTQVIDGLQPGDQYVSENSFLIKADILKSGAAHDH